jgi:hypothetical protein
MKKLRQTPPLFLYAAYTRICRYAEGMTIICVLLLALLLAIFYILVVVR